MARIVNKEMLDRVQELLNEGLSSRKIGKMLGVSQATVTSWKLKYGLQHSDLRFKTTPSRLNMAQELLDRGETFERVAEKVGVSRTTIYQWIDDGLVHSKKRKGR